jgi:hypothetical protein
VPIKGVLKVKAYGLKFIVDENASFIVEEGYEPFLKDVVKLRLGNVLSMWGRMWESTLFMPLG